MTKTTMRMALAAAGVLLAACATSQSGGWTWDGKTYATYEECRAAKRKAAVVGAIGGATTGAVLGGNVGEAALAAGVGAAGGALLARGSRSC